MMKPIASRRELREASGAPATCWCTSSPTIGASHLTGDLKITSIPWPRRWTPTSSPSGVSPITRP